MNPPNPSIAIVGSGAVGGYYGARLAQHGHEVHFLLRSDYAAVAAHGWQVRSCDGDFSLPPRQIRAWDDPRRMPPADLVIVALKATANDQYQRLIAPLLKDDTAILTLQNGLGNEDRLAELFGAQRILGGLAFVCLNRIAPGVLHHIDYGLIKIGEYLERHTPRLDRMVMLMTQSRIPCQPLESLKSGRWEKLTWNIPFSGLGTALGLTTDRLVASETGRTLVAQIIEEVVAIARADGASLPPDIAQTKIRQTQTMGPYKSSMQIDRELGRPMEVEAIFGQPLRAARRLGVAAPKLEMLCELLRVSASANA